MLQSAPPHLRHFIVHLENTMWCTSTPKDRRSLHGCRRCLGKELLLPSMALIGDNKTGLIEYWNQHSKENEWPKDAEIPEEAKKLNEYIRTNIKDLGIFLSDVDLENDLASSELRDTLMNHYGKRNHDDLVNAMQKKKAENMMDMYKWIIPNEFGDESSVQQDLNLHYVGLTRAKDACYIMNGTARFRSKKNDYIFAEPSLFLSKPGLAERRKDVRWEM